MPELRIPNPRQPYSKSLESMLGATTSDGFYFILASPMKCANNRDADKARTQKSWKWIPNLSFSGSRPGLGSRLYVPSYQPHGTHG